MARYIFFYFLLLLIGNYNGYSQQLKNEHIPDTLYATNFNKVPVTFLYRCNNEDYAKIMSDIIDSLYECEGIIKNDIDVKRIEFTKNKTKNDLSKIHTISSAEYLKEDIYDNEIIYACLNCDNKGIFDFNKIRKKLGLKDGELNFPNGDFSTLEILKIAGELLVDNSYIIVFDLLDANKTENIDLQTGNLENKYTFLLSAYLYKIDFDHDMATYFYRDLMLDNEDTVSQNFDMADKLDKHSLKISFIQKYDLRQQTIVIKNPGNNLYSKPALEKAIKNSIDKLLSKIYIKPYSNNYYCNIISNYQSFNSKIKNIKFYSPKIVFIDQNNNVYKLTDKIIWSKIIWPNYDDNHNGKPINYKDTTSSLKKMLIYK